MDQHSLVFPVREGDLMRADGADYVIERHLTDLQMVTLRPTSGGLEVAKRYTELERLWSAGKIEISQQNIALLPKHLQASLRSKLSAFTKEQRSEMLRRLRYCRAVAEVVPRHRRKPSSLAEVAQEIAAAHQDLCPSPQTLREWLRRWEPDQDIRALAPGHRMKGNRTLRLHPAVYAAMEVAALTLLDKRQPNTIKAYTEAHSELVKKFGPDHRLLPSTRTFYRYWADFNRVAKVRFREGTRAVRAKLHPPGAGITVNRPLERVEIDWTKTGVIVVDDTHRMPLGNPWVAFAIDCHTRMICGFHVSFTPPSWQTAAQCIKHAIAPKTEYLAKLNGGRHFGDKIIKNAWPVFGVPTNLIVDCDATWGSSSMHETLFTLGCTLEQMPPYAPQMKGTIERFNRTITEGLFDLLPGQRLKAKVKNQKEYNPLDQAVLTLRQLEFVITKWICDVYHHTDHQGFAS